MSGKADYGSLKEPTYKNSQLFVTAKGSNLAGEDESKRFSIFGAYYDGDNKNGTNDGTDGLKRQTPTEDQRKLLSQYFSQRTLTLTLDKSSNEQPYTLFVSDVFGANNDFAGRAVSNTATPKDSDFVKANNNSVLINLENNTLNFKRIKGGKGVSWRELTGSNNLKPITQASYNLVVIKGAENSQNQINLIGVYDQQAQEGSSSIGSEDRDFYLNPSIFGGDALQADHNIVFLKNVNTDGIARKFGIVGGRAQDGTAVNGSTSVGADSRNNLVLIQNSIIGVDGEKSEGTNVYGGLGYASAQNNAVVIDNTKILGNVSGGLSFLDNVMFDGSYHKFVYGPKISSDGFNADQVLRAFNKGLTEDHNSVYLNQAVLEGTSAVYASSGGLIKTTDDNPQEYIYFVKSKLVNLRRGTVYLNGANRASSIYADTVYFGKVFDSSGKKLLADTYTDAKPLTVTFGHSLSESYIRTSAGFHSTLTRLNEDQSDITHGKHNYWTNVVVNLGDVTTINGDGKHLDTTVPVFEKEVRDGNSYAVAKDTVFSLLAQDNVGGSSTFLAISSGYHTDSDGKILDNTPVRALNLNWSRILKYRLSYASGGRYSKPGTEEPEAPAGQVSPSYSNAAVPLPRLQVFRGGENIFSPSETYVWVDKKGNWYKTQKDYEDGVNPITDKFAFLKEVQTQTAESPEINNVVIQQNGKNVATAQYALLPYLSVGELYEVKEEDTDGRVKNFKGHIFSLTPLLKTDADLFVSKNNVDGTSNIFKGNFDETQLYYRDEDGNFYEEVASAGDIVSVSNLSGTHPEAGGLALGSRLMKLELLDQVVLNGLTGDQTDISTDSYTAEMVLTGNGGIYIPASNTVFIGGEDKQNSFSGKTEVGAAGKLSLVATEALGKTESVVLGSAATLTISKRTDNPTDTSQTIKNINGTDEKTSLVIEKGNSLKLTGSADADAGQIGIVSGAGNLSIENTKFKILSSGTFSGSTNLTASTLTLNKADSLGTSAVRFDNKPTVIFESPNVTSDNNNTFQGEGSLQVNGGSLTLAGKYGDLTSTFTGGLTLENATVTTKNDNGYGWKRVGSGDIALDATSTLTVYYSNDKETTAGTSFKIENKKLSGSGTLNLINSGTNQDSFEFGSKNESGTFTGTLALNNVGISLEGQNATAMGNASLKLDNQSTTAIVKEAFKTTGKVTFLAGATLDFSSVKNHLGAKEISNTITASNGFDFSTSPKGEIKVNLNGTVGNGHASLDLPLLDQDNGPVKLYFGKGNVTGSLANITLVNVNGTAPDLGSQTFDYENGTAELTYSWGLTAGSPLFGTSEGFGLGYKLKTVNVNDGKILDLKPGQDSTLSAKLTSNEGSNSTVKIDGALTFDNGDNNFDSTLILTKDSSLTAVAGALGQKNELFASEVSLEDASTLTLKVGSHTVGSLNTASSSEVVMDAAAELTIRGDSTVEGALSGGKGLNFEGKDGSLLNVKISSSNDQFKAPVSLQYTSLTLGEVSSLGSSTIELDQNSTVQYQGTDSWNSSNIFEGTGSIVYQAQDSETNIFAFNKGQGKFSGTLALQKARIELSDKQKQNVTALQNATLKLENNSSALVIGERKLSQLEMSSGSVLKLGEVDLVNQKAAGSLQVNKLGAIDGQISLDGFTANINDEWSKLLDLDETAYITLVSGPKDTSTSNPQFTYSEVTGEKKLELAKSVEGTFDIGYTNTKDKEIGAFVTSILKLLDVKEGEVTFEKGSGSQGDDFSAGILGEGTIIITDNLTFNADKGATKFKGALKVNSDSSLTLQNAEGLGTQGSHVSVIENSGTINIAEQTYVDRIFGKGNWQLTKGSSSSLHLVNAGGSIGNWSEGTSSCIQGSLGGEGNILIDAGALRIESSNKDLEGKLNIGSQQTKADVKTKAEVILTKTDSIGAMDIEIAEESRLTLEGLNENFDNNLKSNNGNILVTSKSALKINNSDNFHGSYEINDGSTLSFGKLTGFANATNVSADVEKESSLVLRFGQAWELQSVISGGGTIVPIESCSQPMSLRRWENNSTVTSMLKMLMSISRQMPKQPSPAAHLS